MKPSDEEIENKLKEFAPPKTKWAEGFWGGFRVAAKWARNQQPKQLLTLSEERGHQIASHSSTLYDAVVGGFKEARQPKLKPLEWNENFKMGNSIGMGAMACGYQYVLVQSKGHYKDGDKFLLTRYSLSEEEQDFSCTSIEDGKAKAWEDCQNRVTNLFES